MKNIDQSDYEALKEENRKLQKENEHLHKMVRELSTPIIPSIIPETILVPLVGALSRQRIVTLREKILFAIHDQQAENVIIDFTGITRLDISEIGYGEIGSLIEDLTSALKLVGAETLYVGFSTELAKELIQSNVNFSSLKTFASFRMGLQHLMDQKGLTFTKKVL